jgi:hypothetical protein
MLRDDLLFKSIQSLIDNWQTNFICLVIDQGDLTQEKANFLNQFPDKVKYYQVPFDSGLSYSRNFGVQKAKELECDYCFIGSDSFLFNESIQKINELVNFLEATDYSFIGTELTNSTCGWEAKLNLIKGQSFELDFVDKTKKDFNICGATKPSKEWFDENNRPALVGDIIPIWNVDICRNVFIAKIDMLLNVKWDEQFLLAEHEDFFWRLKQANYKGCWTNYITVDKQTDRPNEYAKLRKQNFNEGIKKLREKYRISGWISYVNLERAKEYYKKEG